MLTFWEDRVSQAVLDHLVDLETVVSNMSLIIVCGKARHCPKMAA